MTTAGIEAALRNATDTADVAIGAGVVSSVGEMFDRSFGDQRAVVVADENTFRVAGEEVVRYLASPVHRARPRHRSRHSRRMRRRAVRARRLLGA
jgi:glycerol dehydrogenase-like iron-containing ADH family enzyme